MDSPNEIRRMRDRLRALSTARDLLRDQTQDVQIQMHLAVLEAREFGISYSDIAEDLRISRQRVWQLINDTRSTKEAS